jgi:hypothetical protein
VSESQIRAVSDNGSPEQTPPGRSRRKLPRRSAPARRRITFERNLAENRVAAKEAIAHGGQQCSERRYSDPGDGRCHPYLDDREKEIRCRSLEITDNRVSQYRVPVQVYSSAAQRLAPATSNRLPQKSSCSLWLHELGREQKNYRI